MGMSSFLPSWALSHWWDLTLRGASAARAGEDGRHVFPKPGAVVFRRRIKQDIVIYTEMLIDFD